MMLLQIQLKHLQYVAHSGTVVGILIDKSMDDTRLIELLRNVGLDSVYKKMYTSQASIVFSRVSL